MSQESLDYCSSTPICGEHALFESNDTPPSKTGEDLITSKQDAPSMCIPKNVTRKVSTCDNPKEIFGELLSKVSEHSELRKYLVADLKNIQGKYTRMLARGSLLQGETPMSRMFQGGTGDGKLRRRRSFLELKPL